MTTLEKFDNGLLLTYSNMGDLNPGWIFNLDTEIDYAIDGVSLEIYSNPENIPEGTDDFTITLTDEVTGDIIAIWEF